jgi:hypothetical protein
MQYNFLKFSSKHAELTDTSTDQHTSSKEKLANGWCSTHEHNIYRFSKKMSTIYIIQLLYFCKQAQANCVGLFLSSVSLQMFSSCITYIS